MLVMIALGSVTLMISMVVMLLASILSKKTFMDREKLSPFECGFDPVNSPRMPFSLHFFLIAVIFLIFDVEITLLIPMVQIMKISSMTYLITMIIFVLILVIGTIHEWNQGALEWADWDYS
uniref:NADH-ubiquinone oxidoreductase chain 3 n=1 Tax=Margarinotus merdarius TaxID=878136 RepID=A0A0S2M7T7_MARMD|nr:NADH dehydrogenase subunit 3 [Margarinotus merdarius]ALO70689.1 NADH deshydrogenase subunit 3 [Margarinotus merdarius]